MPHNGACPIIPLWPTSLLASAPSHAQRRTGGFRPIPSTPSSSPSSPASSPASNKSSSSGSRATSPPPRRAPPNPRATPPISPTATPLAPAHERHRQQTRRFHMETERSTEDSSLCFSPSRRLHVNPCLPRSRPPVSAIGDPRPHLPNSARAPRSARKSAIPALPDSRPFYYAIRTNRLKTAIPDAPGAGDAESSRGTG